jgi:hypothetical protein
MRKIDPEAEDGGKSAAGDCLRREAERFAQARDIEAHYGDLTALKNPRHRRRDLADFSMHSGDS